MLTPVIRLDTSESESSPKIKLKFTRIGKTFLKKNPIKTPIRSNISSERTFSKKEKTEVILSSFINPFKMRPHFLIVSDISRIVSSVRPSLSNYYQKFIQMPETIEQKRTLVLDLDETLIHSSVIQDGSQRYPDKSISLKIRPYVKELLEYAYKKFELILFTASNKKYADKVLDQLDPLMHYFKLRVYRESCVETAVGLVKDLRIFRGRNLKDIIIVDNSIFSFAFHLDNGVPIMSWYGDSSDVELLKLIDFLKLLEKVQDVRGIIKNTFYLSSILEINAN